MNILAWLFEKIPEIPLKNNLRYFLAFSPLVPNFISNMSPVKGYVLHNQPKPGDIVIDAGAYPGDYSIWASRKIGPEGRIICFEPDTKNRKVLRKNLEKKALKNFIIVPKGLWDENTILKLKNSDGLHTQLDLEVGDEEIEVVKLDDELKNIGVSKVDILKMDIEGAEIQALQGAEQTLKNNNCSTAIASYHIVNGKITSEFVENFLRKIGYRAKSDYPTHLTTYAKKEENSDGRKSTRNN